MDRLEEVFNGSYRRLVGQLYGVCGDLAEAEDVVAEAFVRAADRAGAFEGTANPEAWLRTVAVNVARTRYRRRAVGERLRLRTARPEPVHPPLPESRIELVRAMRLLPIEQREALALHYLADLPIAQVAEATGVAVGTVKARLNRGRTALAVLLDAESSREENEHA